MRLLNVHSLKFRQFHDRSVPSYVIASHRWTTGEEGEDREATFLDVQEGGDKKKDTKGYKKVLDFAVYVKKHVAGVEWLWIDTCCINKQDAQETSESINSMFRWYRDAAVCLAYLADVKTTEELGSSEWFERGWTLQELVSPRVVVFLSRDWQVLGHKSRDTDKDIAASLRVGPPLNAIVAKITNIPETVLRDYKRCKSLTVEEKLAWMNGRRTTKEEDMSYCLFGIFDAPIGAIYGEGRDRARKRLLAEIRRDDTYLDKLPIANGAAFDDMENELVSECLPDTRVHILQEIDSWAGSKGGARIFWLAGMAGTGKSTIFKTISRRFKDNSSLAATFCFKKGEADRGNASRFMTTICAQLARRFSEVRRSVISVLEQDPDVVRKSLREQFERLILHPLQNAKPPSPAHGTAWVIGIDALDECDNDTEIGIVIDLLAKLDSLESASLRVFVTSRPELPLRLGFGRMSSDTHLDVRLEEITRTYIAHDITIYLRHELADIRATWATLNGIDTGGQDWPGENAVQALVEIAHPLFIFAATACRLLAEPDEDPAESLDTLLKHRLEASQLDRTYLPVLDRLLLNKTERQQEVIASDFRVVVGAILLLSEPLPIPALSRLLDVTETKVFARISRLHSVLDVPSPGDSSRPIRALHLSFRDYVTDPDARNKTPFWIDEAQTHRSLASRCLRLLSDSRTIYEDVCVVKEPGTRRLDISTGHVTKCIPVDVAYACSYWVLHAVKGGERLCHNGPVHRFLQSHFLHWLETLSWLGRLSWVIAFIGDLKSIMKVDGGDGLLAFLEDARRFVLRNFRVIDLAPLQTYSSALLFTPMKSLVRQQFDCDIPAWIIIRPQVVANWGAEIQKLEGHKRAVLAVAYSPDGQTIASGSRDRTVRIWNAMTGAEIQRLVGHVDWVKSIAYSPDGKTIASGSEDCTVRIWNAMTGSEICQLRGHSGSVYSVAYSPSGQTIASGSRDCSVRLWNASTGVQIQELEGHSDPVVSVAYFPNEKTVASGARDGTVRLWDTSTGTELKVHKFGGYPVAFSPDGQTLASAHNFAVQLWDLTTFEKVQKRQSFGPHIEHARNRHPIEDMAFSPNGQTLVMASRRMIYYRNLKTGATQQEELSNDAWSVSFAPDGQTIALAFNDGTVRIWSASIREITQELESRGHDGSVESMVFSSDWQAVWTTSSDDTTRKWDLQSGKQIEILAHEDPNLGRHLRGIAEHDVGVTAFSPDPPLVATVDPGDSTIHLWHIQKGRERLHLRKLEGHTGAVSVMSFFPDGRKLISGSSDRTVRVWDVSSGHPIGMFDDVGIARQLVFSISGDSLDSGTRLVNERNYNIGFDWVDFDLRPHTYGPLQQITVWCATPLELCDAWIQFKGRDVLWLPVEYRGSTWAAQSETIVIGQEHGTVSVLQIRGKDEWEPAPTRHFEVTLTWPWKRTPIGDSKISSGASWSWLEASLALEESVALEES